MSLKKQALKMAVKETAMITGFCLSVVAGAIGICLAMSYLSTPVDIALGLTAVVPFLTLINYKDELGRLERKQREENGSKQTSGI